MAYSISDLPPELLRVIALFLKAPSSDIANFALVCKLFNRAINHSYVWQRFTRRNCTQNFIERYEPSVSTTKPLIWKSFFKENYCSMNEKNISCGFSHTVFLVTLQNGERQPFGCGGNVFGELGLGDTKARFKPQRITGFPANSRILNFNCGLYHTVFLVKLQNGKIQLFGCGDNSQGQLGLGDIKRRFKPQRITGFPVNSRILNVSCGDCHTVFLVKLQNGEIQPFGCGNNTDGQLGLGDTKRILKPQRITGFPANSRILNFNCGSHHTVFLVKFQNGERQLFSCGGNFFGELGLGYMNIKRILKPQRITGFPENSRILNFNCGCCYTVFLVKLQNGARQLFGCGDNADGQLGLGDTKRILKPQRITGFPANSRILNFNCGSHHTVFLVKFQNGERQLFGCGDNADGQLGIKPLAKIKNVTKLHDMSSFEQSVSQLPRCVPLNSL